MHILSKKNTKFKGKKKISYKHGWKKNYVVAIGNSKKNIYMPYGNTKNIIL